MNITNFKKLDIFGLQLFKAMHTFASEKSLPDIMPS